MGLFAHGSIHAHTYVHERAHMNVCVHKTCWHKQFCARPQAHQCVRAHMHVRACKIMDAFARVCVRIHMAACACTCLCAPKIPCTNQKHHDAHTYTYVCGLAHNPLHNGIYVRPQLCACTCKGLLAHERANMCAAVCARKHSYVRPKAHYTVRMHMHRHACTWMCVYTHMLLYLQMHVSCVWIRTHVCEHINVCLHMKVCAYP